MGAESMFMLRLMKYPPVEDVSVDNVSGNTLNPGKCFAPAVFESRRVEIESKNLDAQREKRSRCATAAPAGASTRRAYGEQWKLIETSSERLEI